MASYLETLKKSVLSLRDEVDMSIDEVKELAKYKSINEEVKVFLDHAKGLLGKNYESLNEDELIIAGRTLNLMKTKLVEIKAIVEKAE